jgi:predicted glycosyltransferase
VLRAARSWIWVDFENTPHVLFLEPFVRKLREDGWYVRISAKPQSQTLALAAARGLTADSAGSGDFNGTVAKVFGGVLRSLSLLAWLRQFGSRPRLLLSGSRSACLAAFLARVPSLAFLDYEHTELRPFALGARVWVPDVLRSIQLPSRIVRHTRYYAGLKENLYLDNWKFDRVAERRSLGVDGDEYLVVARPPATTAHYAADRSIEMWFAATEHVLRWPRVRVVVSPRTTAQRDDLRLRLGARPTVTILERVTAGPGLVAAADLIIGGGGTMNREAAVLGVPVWSVFCGPTPQIDAQLAAEGRLRWVRSEHELEQAIAQGSPKLGLGRGPFREGFAAIYNDVLSQLGLSASDVRLPKTYTIDSSV